MLMCVMLIAILYREREKKKTLALTHTYAGTHMNTMSQEKMKIVV